jgi:hypothetical protein
MSLNIFSDSATTAHSFRFATRSSCFAHPWQDDIFVPEHAMWLLPDLIGYYAKWVGGHHILPASSMQASKHPSKLVPTLTKSSPKSRQAASPPLAHQQTRC